MSDFIGSGERVDGPDGLRIFFRSLRPAEKPRAVSIDKTLKFGGIAETHRLLDFCAEHNVTADIEKIPMSYLETADKRMLKSDVKYRFVIDMVSLRRTV